MFFRGTQLPPKDGVYELKNGKFARYELGMWHFAFASLDDAIKTPLKAAFMSPQFRIYDDLCWRMP